MLKLSKIREKYSLFTWRDPAGVSTIKERKKEEGNCSKDRYKPQ